MMKAQIEAQKKLAEMVIAIADSHFEQNDYEIYQVYSLKKLSESKTVFNYINEIDHTLELIIGLDDNLKTYKVFGVEDLLFASKDVEVVIEFLNQQVDEFEAEFIRNRV